MQFDRETAATLISGRDRIYKGMAKHQFRWLWPDCDLLPTAGCTKEQACPKAIKAALIALWRPVPNIALALRPYDKEVVCPGLCRACSSVLQTDFQKEQKAFWKDLPTYFGLPTWEKLSRGPLEAEMVVEA
jgi:hypothetical protein